jgi:hypothetical protein
MVIRAAGKVALACALALALWTDSAQALSLQQIGSFEQPIFLTSDPGNPERLFVVERKGVVRLVESGTVSTFADVHELVSTAGEGGLLSIALSPSFDQDGRLFLDYTGTEQATPEIHVAEMRADASRTTAPLNSLRNLLTIPHPEDTNHYGGQLQFGPEGDLFISTGDGGGKNDVHENAQNLERPLGKLLRIDPNPSGLLPYTVPPGNPFAGVPGDYAPVFAYGLRNPFRFSFDRLTGALSIADVGQSAREEVDFAPAPDLGAGANYGWNCMEGSLEGPATDPQCAALTPEVFVPPIFEYPHSEPEGGGAYGSAIIGGYVARGPGLGDLYGRYVYGDWGTGLIRSFLPSDPYGTDRLESIRLPEETLDSFGEDSCGRLYALSGEGPVYRLVGSEASTCPTSSPPPPPLSPTYLGIRAERRQVKRNRRALISAWVAPCRGRAGQPVSLWQGRRRIGVRHLDKVCTVHFRPRIRHRTVLRARVFSDGVYADAASRRLSIRILRRQTSR